MRYAELRPDELEQAFGRAPIAVWPIGALEWHGPHLPLGLDGLVAEAFAQRLAERHSAVLLPTYWHPITTLPHPMSLDIPTPAFRAVLKSTVEGLRRAGAKVVCIVSGHYAQGHSLELFRFAESARDPLVITASPLEPLEDDALLDHAGKWETAQLLAIRPDLVKNEALPDELEPRQHAVLGKDPREGDAKDAARKQEESLKRWTAWIEAALDGRTDELHQFYKRRQAVYAPYEKRYYRTSWEDAIQNWWTERVNDER